MLSRLVAAADADPAFRLVGAHAHPDWLDEMDGVVSWRRTGDHLHANVALGPGVSIGDGLIVLPPGSLPVETVNATFTGRPVTDVVAHPHLDARMVVTGANGSDRVQCWISTTMTRIPVEEAVRTLREGRRP